MSISHSIVEITPAIAQEMLEHNAINRPLKAAAIKRYAEDMATGRWKVGGSVIVQRDDGMLLDGQNRLHACIEAGTPFSTLFVTGAESEVMDTIDTGVQRSLSDQLHWRGVSNANTVAAAVKWAYNYDKMIERGYRQYSVIGSPPRHEWLDYFEQYEPYFTSANAAIIPLRRRIVGSQSIPMFVHFLISRIKDFKTADAFWHEVAYGSEPSAALLLQDWLGDRRGPYKRPPLVVQAAMQIKAARFWLKGENPKKLMWKRTAGAKGEPFPRIDQDV